MSFLTLLMVVGLVPFGILAVILGDGHPSPPAGGGATSHSIDRPGPVTVGTDSVDHL